MATDIAKWEILDKDGQPGSVQRSCTDVPSLILFVVTLAVFVLTSAYGFAKGDARRLVALPDSRKHFCGTPEKQGDLKAFFDKGDGPLLFYCWPLEEIGVPGAPERMCVGDCAMTPGYCQPYKSAVWGEALCFPLDHKRKGEVLELVWGDDHAAVHLFQQVANVARGWPAILVAALASVMLGFAYLHFIADHAGRVFETGLALSVLVPAAVGGYLLLVANYPPYLPRFKVYSVGDPFLDLTTGILMCSVALVALVVYCCYQSSIRIAQQCAEAAAECALALPELVFMTLGAAAALMVFLAVFLSSFLHLISVAHPGEGNEIGQFDVHFKGYERICIALHLFSGVWVAKFLVDLSSFAAAYCTERWFFVQCLGGDGDAGQEVRGLSLVAYYIVLRYHMGTIAIGSLIWCLGAPLKLVMEAVSAAASIPCAHRNNLAASACSSCLDLHRRLSKYVGKNAYMAVALSGGDFRKGAEHAAEVFGRRRASARILAGAIGIIGVVGILGISAIAAAIQIMALLLVPGYSDPSNQRYIGDPAFVAIVGAFVGCLISTPFMLLYDVVADTLLFSYTHDQAEHPWRVCSPGVLGSCWGRKSEAAKVASGFLKIQRMLLDGWEHTEASEA